MASSVAPARAISEVLVTTPDRVQFDDGAIHTRGQPKIVGVDDEAAHGVSLSTCAGVAFRMVNTLVS